LKVGDILKVKATLSNNGCAYTLGLPKYYLYIQTSSPESIFIPNNPAPVTHYLGISPGQSDTAEFELKAISGGQATLGVRVSMEVHLGYPGPAYWGEDNSQTLTVNVEPSNSSTPTDTPPPTESPTPTVTPTWIDSSTPTDSPTVTLTIAPTPTPTLFGQCTPPACSGGVLTCGNPNGCLGGCGTICLTETPTP
jgi:hypothetical protein